MEFDLLLLKRDLILIMVLSIVLLKDRFYRLHKAVMMEMKMPIPVAVKTVIIGDYFSGVR